MRRGKTPWLFSWTLCVETDSPLDTHPRENSPFNAERHLLQPPCLHFFCFFVSPFAPACGIRTESVEEKTHGSWRAWLSVRLACHFFFTFFFFNIYHAKPVAGDESVTGWWKLFHLFSFFSRPAGASLQDGKIHVAPVQRCLLFLSYFCVFLLAAVKCLPSTEHCYFGPNRTW